MFYRPEAGYAQTFETRVPLRPRAAVRRRDAAARRAYRRRKANLWLVKIPLDREKLASFSDMELIEIEFTKKVYQYRSYPDPISYGYHQGGLPSGVHVYAATLGESPVNFEWKPDRFGHVWTSPEVPAYTANVTNRSAADMTGKITVTTRSYDGSEETKAEQPVTVPAGKSAPVKFSLPVKLNGYHDLVATLDVKGSQPWSERRSFVRLAPDSRSRRSGPKAKARCSDSGATSAAITRRRSITSSA
jgi:hypothetical protein